MDRGVMRPPLPLGLQSNEYYFELRRKNKVINSFIFFFFLLITAILFFSLRYSITEGNQNNIFSIDSMTGKIQTIQKLDRETKDSSFNYSGPGH